MGRFTSKHPYIIALDFDGTIKEGKKYELAWTTWRPTVGFNSFYAWANSRPDTHLVLWTCRNVVGDERERLAVKSFLKRYHYFDIDVDFLQGRAYTKNGTLYEYWGTGSKKQYADFYVDDLAVGCPMLDTGTPDWKKIRKLIESQIRSDYVKG